mmetsp:Transcript_6333/g.9890  ORF Transcript_6333/g.9890 Transcript_6333/m.9890 type:complete len:84 (+) Transcript_6333:355-606(+)
MTVLMSDRRTFCYKISPYMEPSTSCCMEEGERQQLLVLDSVSYGNSLKESGNSRHEEDNDGEEWSGEDESRFARQAARISCLS